MADKKITINVDNSDENADWIKRVRDDNAKKEKEEKEVKKTEEEEQEIEDFNSSWEEEEVDADEDPTERLNKLINNQRD